MTLDNAAYLLAGILIGFVAGLVVEYLQKVGGADAAAAIAKVNAEADAEEKAIAQKTQDVLDKTPGLSGKDLADALNEDLATPPGGDVPSLRGASNAGADPGEPAGEPPVKPAE